SAATTATSTAATTAEAAATAAATDVPTSAAAHACPTASRGRAGGPVRHVHVAAPRPVGRGRAIAAALLGAVARIARVRVAFGSIRRIGPVATAPVAAVAGAIATTVAWAVTGSIASAIAGTVAGGEHLIAALAAEIRPVGHAGAIAEFLRDIGVVVTHASPVRWIVIPDVVGAMIDVNVAIAPVAAAAPVIA